MVTDQNCVRSHIHSTNHIHPCTAQLQFLPRQRVHRISQGPLEKEADGEKGGAYQPLVCMQTLGEFGEAGTVE